MASTYPDSLAKTKAHRPALRLAALFAATALSTARADDAPLTGAPAWARIVGNTVSGMTPDGPYAEFFAPDGTLRLVDTDGKAGGRWTLRDDKLCTQVDDEDEDCRAIMLTGTSGAFTDDGGGRYPFDILPGNAKGL